MEGTQVAFRHLDGPTEGFDTQQEAEVSGIEIGKKWIDAGKPKFH
jgi:hypothetical protein